jgi:O-acetyl-ADP-ribose deacetylase (regulator of RNase III)
MRIATYVGSIVDPALGAHAILNAANPEVALGSGVSGAIRAECGGAAYQREVREAWIEQFDEPLGPDDCVVTGAGTSTAFRWVLHVPAVDYRKPDPETGRPSGPARVRACTSAALREAARLAHEHGLEGQFVLAVALLGAGHGGLGEVASADAMMGALRDARDVHSVLAEVRFVVLSDTLERLVRHAAEKHGF